MNKPHLYTFSLVTILALLLYQSFVATGISAAQENKADYIQSIALMPFWLGKPEPGVTLKDKSFIDCTLGQLCYLENDPLDQASDILNEITQHELKSLFNEKVIPFEKSESTYISMDKEDTETLRLLAVRFGKKMDVDLVMAGTLWRYRERQGTAYAAESPASVAFSLFLINVDNGNIYWKGSFNKTQPPLSENLLNAKLYFKEGLKWFTAREFATLGVKNLLKEIDL